MVMIGPSFARTLKRCVWLIGAAAVCAAGLVAAQPTAPAPPLSAPAPEVAPGAPGAHPPGAPAPVPEEAPPQEAPTPPPVVVPPISEQEIAPAPQGNATAEAKPVVPPRRARYDVAVLEALDKITAESLIFEAPVGKPIRYNGLIFTVRACERSTSEEPVDDAIAYLTIASQPRAEAGRPIAPARQVFKGWMYASSPGLNPLEHPVYDAWVISCRAAAPGTLASR